ncbi:MAG: hypothetical protein IT303_15255 [Dehalococcoidia bacterium]|nr:hypothetical protein [Dehalococcoidia bacterium]
MSRPAEADDGGTTVVAIARDAVEAAIWTDALRDAGIEAAAFERGPGAALGGAAPPWSSYPVVVPAGRLAAARNVIAELAGGAVLAPYRDIAEERARRARVLWVAGGAAAVVLGFLVVALLVG